MRGITGQFVTNVSVLVTMADGEPFATTVASAVVASWEPPLLAVLIQIGSRTDAALARSETFTVNVLGEADHGLARRFARPDRGQGWDAFAGVPLQRQEPWPPVFTNAIVWAVCRVTRAIEVGDHRCYLGDILTAHRHDEAAPLAYYRGRFHEMGAALAPANWDMDGSADPAAHW